MRRRSFDFVEDAPQMGDDYQAELLSGAGLQAAGLLEGREQAVEGNILAEEKNFMLALEVVVKVGGSEVGGGGDVAHTGFGKAADAELFSGGAEDFQAACKITALNAGLVPASDPFARQFGLLAARTMDISKVTRRERSCQQQTNTCSDNEQPFSATEGHSQNSQPPNLPRSWWNGRRLTGTAQRGKSRAELSYRILRLASSRIGRAWNFSMLPLISGTPGPGQSVPQRTLSAISSMRGKYSKSFCGGMPEMSMCMFLWRRTRKNASSIQSGLPPCARITTRSG